MATHALSRACISVVTAILLSSCTEGCTNNGTDGTGAITGTLCGQSGRPTQGIIVEAVQDGTSVGQATQTDSDGKFRLGGLHTGAYGLRLTPSAGPVRTIPGIDVVDGQETTVEDPECGGGGIIKNNLGAVRGHVCNRLDGQWVTGASVSLTASDGNARSATTDDTGSFAITGVPTGLVTVRVQRGAFDRTWTVQVSSGRDTWVDNSTECLAVDGLAGGVEGMACAPDGSPAGGAVALLEANGARFSDVVDTAGHFILSGIPAGSWTLEILSSSFAQSFAVSVQVNMLTQVAAPNCSVECSSEGACNPIDPPVEADAGIVYLFDAGTRPPVDSGPATGMPDASLPTCTTPSGAACVCRPGVTTSCYSGPDGTAGVGICRAGTQLCVDGDWGPCVGEVTRRFEVCNGEDDNCNGETDEGLACAECIPGNWQDCYTGPANTEGVGACQPGRQSCNDGEWGLCLGQGRASPEACNGVDDDCDGATDEGLTCECTSGQTRACYGGPSGTQGVGICRGGVERCNAVGQWEACSGAVFPGIEVCNDADDDCDGQLDEGCAACAEESIIYANTQSELYSVNPDTLQITRKGAFGWPGDGYSHQMTDIAVTKGGVIYGLTFDALYTVSRYSLQCTLVTPLSGDQQFNALSFLPSSGGTERLVAATGGGSYYEINRSTGEPIYLGAYGSSAGSAGDIVSVDGAGTFASVNQGGSEKLARLNDATGAATLVGATGEVDTWGLAYWGGRLFGFLEEGKVVLMDPSTGSTSPVASTPNQHWWGAGVTTCAPTE